jgi:hypothetical protein
MEDNCSIGSEQIRWSVTNQICQENATSAADPGGGFGVLDPPFIPDNQQKFLGKIEQLCWKIVLNSTFYL